MLIESRPNVVHGKTNLYGYSVGILMIEGYFPRLPGAIGNATTFPFPVLHKVVKGATGDQMVHIGSEISDPVERHTRIVIPWIEAAKQLELEGVRAITTSCGFAAMFQRELASAVSVPVFASSLLLLPMLSHVLPPSKRIGVITADATKLNRLHYEGVGVDVDRVTVVGLENCEHFVDVSYNDRHTMEVNRVRDEVIGVALDVTRRHSDIGMLLLECSLLPPFAAAVQEATALPVFDFTTMISMIHNSMVRVPFKGYI